MSTPFPELDPELEELIEAERSAGAPGDALGRVWLRLGDPAGASARPERPSGVTAARVPWGPGTALAALVIGLGAGAALHAALRPQPPERLVFVDRAIPATMARAPVSAPDSPAPASAPPSIALESLPSVASQPGLAAPPAPIPAPAAALTEERGVLEQARLALTDGDSARALSLTDAHARRFAHPQFGEEREAIAIQALVIGRRYDEARARAARFTAQSPSSLFRPVVEASIASIP